MFGFLNFFTFEDSLIGRPQVLFVGTCPKLLPRFLNKLRQALHDNFFHFISCLCVKPFLPVNLSTDGTFRLIALCCLTELSYSNLGHPSCLSSYITLGYCYVFDSSRPTSVSVHWLDYPDLSGNLYYSESQIKLIDLRPQAVVSPFDP